MCETIRSGLFSRTAGMLAVVGLTLGFHAASAQDALQGDRIATAAGDLVIHPIGHATMALGWDGRVLYVDPVGGAEAFDGLPAPDLILVTDVHGDHLNADTIAGVLADDTRIIAPEAVAAELPEALRDRVEVLANGETTTALEIGVEAIPMYNLTEERLQYHEPGRGNGYVLTFAETRVYIAGDTEDIPEMRALTEIDVAFVPMNLPFTMTEEQAADAVREFQPRIVYPYHHRGSDVDLFRELVGTDLDIEVRLRDWY